MNDARCYRYLDLITAAFVAALIIWSRTIASTLVGQAVDTVVFLAVAFLGFLALDELRTVFISTYVFKVGIEVLFTPITYGVVSWLKWQEREDYCDRSTSLNPLPVGGD